DRRIRAAHVQRELLVHVVGVGGQGAVHVRARQDDHPLDAVGDGVFEEPFGPEDVDLVPHLGIAPEMTHEGVMHDRIGPFRPEHVLELPLADVEDVHAYVGRMSLPRSAVDADDAATAAADAPRDESPLAAGDSRDQHRLHRLRDDTHRLERRECGRGHRGLGKMEQLLGALDRGARHGRRDSYPTAPRAQHPGGGITLAAEVPVGLEPVAVAARVNLAGRTEAWVVNHLSDSVSVVEINPTDATLSRVVATLLVGDEPRDIVFAGSNHDRAFITCTRRGQNRFPSDPANGPQLTTEGIGRADVWVFNANSLGAALGGTPIGIVQLFGDTPRALAASPDGTVVYAAILDSGNQTTTITEQ